MNLGRLRAPREDGSLLAVPPLNETDRLLEANQRRFRATSLDILGWSLQDLRDQARRDVAGWAGMYRIVTGEPEFPYRNAPWIAAGHQPELSHPGVWVKSFALNGLAKTYGCNPLNLVVDTDTVKSTAVRVPIFGETAADVGLATVPYDKWTGEIAYEERLVRDEALFAGFGSQATALLAPWGYSPMLPDFWGELLHQAKRTGLLGERFAGARRAFERQWGCHNAELPVSLLCQTESFIWFASHLISNLGRFHEAHNGALQEHRRRHGIRSKNHPVADLTRDGDWLETPFWAWRKGAGRRQPLMTRLGSELELRAGAEPWPSLSAPDKSRALVTDWEALEGRGYKIRSRALTTTLFTRLFVADLFIHGIGGGKYDELTDEIIRRFYAIEPPGFMVLTATLLLPLDHFSASVAERHHLQRAVRDLHYNPQRYLAGSGVAANGNIGELVAAKHNWIKREPADRPARRQRFETIRRLNDQLAPYVKDREATARGELERIELQLAANAILQRRDFAFCLCPEEKLRTSYKSFLEGLF